MSAGNPSELDAQGMSPVSPNQNDPGMQDAVKFAEASSKSGEVARQVQASRRVSASGAQGLFGGGSLHVLFLIDQLCQIGGAERSLLLAIRMLQEKGVCCSLATFRVDPTLEVFRDFPCRWHLFPLRRSYDWNALQMALRLRRLIRSEHVRVVHTFFETSDLWGGVVAKLSGCRGLVSSRRDMGILRAPKHRFAYRLVNRLFDRVLAVSEEVRSFCIQQDGLPPHKVITLYNGINMEEIAAAPDETELRAELGLAPASPVIITVAHLRRVKGIDVLVDAAGRVCREFPDATFLVVGKVLEPEYGDDLQRQIRALGLAGRVRFLGLRGDVFSLLKMSDIFCLPSRSEGFSNALLEAMACGLPCVVTRVGGNPEAVDEDRSGFIVSSEDAGAIADRLLTLLRNTGRARHMGRVGRQIVETKFAAEAQTRKLFNVYRDLLEWRQA